MWKYWIKRHRPTFLASAWLIGELLVGLGIAIYETWQPTQRVLDGLSPDLAFGWIQIAINTSMIALITWCIWGLAQVQLRSDTGEIWRWNVWNAFALLGVLIFTLPASWLWLSALWRGVSGNWSVINQREWHYVISALCQPILCVATMRVLWLRYWRLYRTWKYSRQINRNVTP